LWGVPDGSVWQPSITEPGIHAHHLRQKPTTDRSATFKRSPFVLHLDAWIKCVTATIL
jgi:hypothetical protein